MVLSALHFGMKRTALLAITVGVIASASSLGWNVVQQKEGYTNTPFIFTGSKWRVHDSSRPVPPVVTPAPGGAPVAAPSDAIILFNGKDLSKWSNQKWKIVGDAMMCREEGEKVVGVGDTATIETFEDFQLHAEWATPTPKGEKSQGRGNSGIFLSGKYEVQVLDSYENPTYADGQAGAIYGQKPPMANAARKPTEWQTYDIFYTSPRFDAAGKLTKPGFVTVVHNGVLVQNHHEILGNTNHKSAPAYVPHGPGPIRLQDHSNATRFRNIWIRPIKDAS